MNYYLRTEKNRKLSIEKAGSPIYTIEFTNWTGSEAKAHLPDAEYTFRKKNFWCNSYIIEKNGIPIGAISGNWKGHLLFKLAANHQELTDLVPSHIADDSYIIHKKEQEVLLITMKRKGFFAARFEVFQNKDPRPLLTLHTETNWFKVNYRVVLHHPDLIIFPLEELLGMLGFGAILIRKRAAAAA